MTSELRCRFFFGVDGGHTARNPRNQWRPGRGWVGNWRSGLEEHEPRTLSKQFLSASRAMSAGSMLGYAREFDSHLHKFNSVQ